MSGRDMSAFIGHVVMAMRFVADFIDGMTLDDFLADRKTRDAVIRTTEGPVPTRHAIARSPRGWMCKKRRRQFPAAAVLATNHQPSLKLPPPRLALWRSRRLAS